MSRWFRHYAGMMRDEKLVSAAIRSSQSIERVTWVWGAILESAAEINDDGKYHLDTAEVAYFLRADEADILGIVRSLEQLDRLYDGRVAKWSNRQYKSDQSADRVRSHRERRRTVGEAGEEPRNVTVDECNGDVTLRNAPETETETEKKEDSPKRVRTLCSEEFEGFWKSYPRTPNMSKSEAWKAWQRLPPDDQSAATKAVAKYVTWLKGKPDHPVVHACRFISQRRFDGFSEPDNVVPIESPTVFVPVESPRWGPLCARWRETNRKTSGPPPRDHQGQSGWWFQREWLEAARG